MSVISISATRHRKDIQNGLRERHAAPRRTHFDSGFIGAYQAFSMEDALKMASGDSGIIQDSLIALDKIPVVGLK